MQQKASASIKAPKSNPFNKFNETNSNKFSINLDWLQMHCSESEKFVPQETATIIVERTGQSKVFKSIYSIKSKKHNRVLATYATEALEQIMPDGHGVIKIDNFYLYHYAHKIKEFVEWLFRRLKLNFIGHTRIDIAYDFNYFCNKRGPEAFIKSFLRNDIVKLKDTKFRLAGKHEKINTYNWITFGSKTSKITYKLYNKTQEMKDMVHKTHVFQDWQKSKLDTEKNIWRIEFTINSNTNLLFNSFGAFNYHSLNTLDLQNICGLFRNLFESYFDFKYNDRKQQRKDRMKKITLLIFPEVFGNLRMIRINPFEKDHTRGTKIFVKKMNELQDELRGKDDNFVFDARELISKLISVYNLQDWAQKKGVNFDKIEYAKDLDF